MQFSDKKIFVFSAPCNSSGNTSYFDSPVPHPKYNWRCCCIPNPIFNCSQMFTVKLLKGILLADRERVSDLKKKNSDHPFLRVGSISIHLFEKILRSFRFHKMCWSIRLLAVIHSKNDNFFFLISHFCNAQFSSK